MWTEEVLHLVSPFRSGRRILVGRVLAGRPVAHVAAEMGIPRPTTHKWVRRWRAEGVVAGFAGRGRLYERAPAACWWARTIVESTETARPRSPSASAWATSAVKTRSQVPSTAHIRSRS